MVPDGELLQALRFSRTPKEEAAADKKVIELLGKSPYRDKLADAGLFFVHSRSRPGSCLGSSSRT